MMFTPDPEQQPEPEIIQLSEETKEKIRESDKKLEEVCNSLQITTDLLKFLFTQYCIQDKKKFWKFIYSEHPELEQKDCTYDPEKEIIIVTGDKNQPTQEVSEAIH